MPNNLLPLPSNAFSGAAVKFDLSPVNRMLLLSANIDAKNAARQQGLEKFIGQENNKLTPTGVRTSKDENGRSDMGDYMGMVKDWNDYVQANRKALQNPNLDGGKAWAEANTRYNNARAFANESKQRAADMVKLDTLNKNLAQSGGFLPPEVLSDAHAASLPINNTNHRPIDWSKMTYNPKPWSTSDESGLSNEVGKYKGQTTYGQPIRDTKAGTQTTVGTTNFSQDELAGIYGAGANRYNTSAGYKKMIDDMVKTNPAQVVMLGNLFKEHFGRDLENEHDIAAAYALSKNGNAKQFQTKPTKITYTLAEKTAAAQQRQINVANATNRGRGQIAVDKNSKDFLDTVKPLSDSWDSLTDPNTSVKIGILQTDKNDKRYDYSALGQDVVGRPLPVSAKLQNLYKRTFTGANGKKEVVLPTFHVPDADPSKAYPIYNGHPEASTPISKEQLFQDHYKLEKGAPINQQKPSGKKQIAWLK